MLEENRSKILEDNWPAQITRQAPIYVDKQAAVAKETRVWSDTFMKYKI